jgi:hypothetical protein
VLQLQASGGGQTDTAQTRFTVNEAPFTADFTPADGGSGAVTFSGGRGDLVLQSVTSALSVVPENPVSCSWTVISGPGVVSPGVGALGGPLLDGSSSLVATKDCIQTVQFCIPFLGCFNFPVLASATLNVASSTLNQNYVVQFTASTVTSKTVTHTIKVAENPPVPSISVTSGTAVTFTGNPPFASISLSGSSTGIPPFSFAWSIDAEPGGAVVPSSITSGASTSTLFPRETGQYTVRLTVTDNTGAVGAATSTFTVAPFRGTTFANMTQNFIDYGCTGCHQFFSGFNNNPDPATNNTGTTTNLFRPSWENVNDSNGKTLWQRVFQRTISGNTARSLIILNPRNANDSGFNDNPNGAGYTTPHGGGCQFDFGCGSGPDTSRLTIFQNWVLDGGPPGN